MGTIATNETGAVPNLDELASRLRFSYDNGRIWLGETRMILLHSAAMASLRKELVDSLGAERARGVLTRTGYASGARDAELARKLCPNASDADVLGMGPLLHTLEGIVTVRTVQLDIDIAEGRYYGEFLWDNSFEADTHSELFGVDTGPACWMQTGYACGYTSTVMGRSILYKETDCRASGAHACRIVGKPAGEWEDAEDLQRYLRPDSLAEHILELQEQVQNLRYSIDDDLRTDDLIGDSAGFRETCALIRKAAHSQVTVLLLGETGVGKEMFARALHGCSTRASGPFVAVNCAALPEALIESELFGVEKGAFTGAHQSRPGRFERAQRGTLFLDEVGELSASAQAKLLRVLQEGEIERIGDSHTRKVDVRVIAATNVDLQEAVEQGRFRRDLFYRLNIYPVNIPPLRERAKDIPLLVQRFVDKQSARHAKKVVGVTDKAMHAMRSYAWPGNVRELENVIERGVILAPPGGRIDLGDLFPGISAGASKGRSTGVGRDGSVRHSDEHAVDAFLDHVFARKTGLDAVEALLLKAALERAGGNVSSAARALGMTRPQFEYRLKKRNLLP
ncbi:MAG: sigma 54-interacting transcriptional regulator [Rhodocyclales bacterium]|nr:sigma 54-interacting transcriptional regulator [Rhodocyclales bacterium]